MNRMLPILTTIGEQGHIEEYMIDTNKKVVRRLTYYKNALIREFTAPLDIEVPGWSMNGTFMKVL